MAKGKKRPPLSEAQLEIMNVVWEQGEVTVADVWETLNENRSLARNTVQTTLTRLKEKGWLKAKQKGTAFYFSAAIEKSDAIGGLLSRMVDTAFSGSTENLVMALLDQRGIDKKEADKIRAMIEKAEKGN